jgi:hypothetical protein
MSTPDASPKLRPWIKWLIGIGGAVIILEAIYQFAGGFWAGFSGGR